MKKLIALFMYCLVIVIHSGSVFSQDQSRSLYIIEEKTRIPVTDVMMQKDDGTSVLTSDESGRIKLDQNFADSGIWMISRIGYRSITIDFSALIFDGGEAVVTLTPAVTSLKEISVKADQKGGIFKTISELDVHLRPINNAQEVLRIVPGLFIGQHAGGGKAEQLFLRGFDLDHGTDIQLNVDGVPVNMVSHAHGQGYADLHFVIPELIEKVQFNKGPYFADKGNFNTAGFVDFSTKKFLQNDFVKIEAGRYNTFRTVAGINLLKQKGGRRTQSLYMGGEAMYTQGYFDSPQNFNRFNFIGKYHSQLNTRNAITATATAFSSGWNASGQVPERKVKDGTIGFYGSIDDKEGGETSRYNAIVVWEHDFADGATFSTLGYLTRYQFELYSNFTFFKEDTVNGDQIRQKESRWLTGFTSRYQKNMQMGGIKSRLNAGVQLRYDDIDNLELSGTLNRSTIIRPIMAGKVNELNISTHLSQKMLFNPSFDITLSARLDYFFNRYEDHLSSQLLHSQSAIVSPKLNLTYRPGRNLEFYLYAGKGFHSNDTRVAVLQNGKKVVPPAWGADLGAIVKPADKLVVQSALWYLWLDQEFVYVGDEGVIEAGGQSRRFGIDVSARYELLRFFYADLDLNFTQPRAQDPPEKQNYLPLAPVFTSAGGLTYRKTTGWNGGVRYRYMHDRPANEDYSTVAKGYFILDAAINYTKPKWELGLQVQNLLNTRWKETQFDTESRLKEEPEAVSEIHFTPGTPFFARLSLAIFF